MPEALAVFAAERVSLVATAGLAAQRGWDEQVGQLAASMCDSLTRLRYLDDLLTVREAALAAARRAGDTHGEGGALNNPGEGLPPTAMRDDSDHEQAARLEQLAASIRSQRSS
jgi:hypothetical protein